MSMPRVVLASASPRRRELLTLIGIAHDVIPADVDETYVDGEQPREHAKRLARAKVAKVAASETQALVIGSDTIVVIDGTVLGKPQSDADAVRMLMMLSGRTHVVMTAVAAGYEGQVVSGLEEVCVTFRDLTLQEANSYVATREPMDKAGAYGIQGFGATIVQRVEGDYFAVMGLPIVRMVGLMRELGIVYDFGR